VGDGRPRRRRPALALGRRAARRQPGGVRRRDRPTAAGRPAGARVLDLAGNVQEWVDGAYTAGSDDGRAVVRGGAFLHGANELRCSHRQAAHPGARDHYIGFRVAATAAEPRLAFDWAAIPGGAVPIGRDPVSPGGPALADELPAHTVDVPAFELSRTPVTNAAYARFVAEAGAEPPPHWPGGRPPAGLGDHPVTFVDWFAARACCAWADGRLPTEAEWEKAARGTDGRIYPWGSEEDATRAAVGLGLKQGATRPVDGNPAGASPYGVLGLAGNVWEWVSTAYAPYPYDPADGREDAGAVAERVLRGGSYASASLTAARCAARSRSEPSRRQSHIGFRIARSPG
jgi:formylglycine-generating enzyme required for sulfatase activity